MAGAYKGTALPWTSPHRPRRQGQYQSDSNLRGMSCDPPMQQGLAVTNGKRGKKTKGKRDGESKYMVMKGN